MFNDESKYLTEELEKQNKKINEIIDNLNSDTTIDEVTRQVVYDYTVQRALGFNEMVSLLGNMRLDNTKFGESTYETKKLVIPCKGKNFSVKIKGESNDHLGIESFGFTFKLGKVRDE